MRSPLRILFLTISPFMLATAHGVEPAASFQPKPVPALQVLPLPHDQASFQLEGRELTRYHFGADGRRPFLYPLIGPSGRSLTRMGHPHDPVGHSHHNSIWVSHHSVGGVDFWGDRGKNTGRIVHQRLERYTDDDTGSSLLAFNHWLADSGEVMLHERRQFAVSVIGEGEFLVTLDLELIAPGKDVELGKTPFGLIGVRMAKTIGVHDGGGTIRNSTGGVNEAGVFWKSAQWCDYSGAIAPGAVEGITLMDHPQNPNHPTVFHVRDDGWMGASLTFDAPRTITPSAPLRLRYGFYVHRGLREVSELQSRWQAFAQSQQPATLQIIKKK